MLRRFQERRRLCRPRELAPGARQVFATGLGPLGAAAHTIPNLTCPTSGSSPPRRHTRCQQADVGHRWQRHLAGGRRTTRPGSFKSSEGRSSEDMPKVSSSLGISRPMRTTGSSAFTARSGRPAPRRRGGRLAPRGIEGDSTACLGPGQEHQASCVARSRKPCALCRKPRDR